MQAPHCLNCEHPVTQQQNFCSTCGQKTAVHRLTLHDVGHDTVHYFTHADKGVFSLIWQLINKPGLVAREYVEGKRKKYFPPLNFYLIVAAICLFMTSMLYSLRQDPMTRAASSNSIHQRVSPELQAKINRGMNVGKFFSKYTNLVTMAAVPLLSFIVYLFYRKGKYNYTEHLVANMYIAGFTVLVYSFVFLPAQTFVKGSYILYIFFFSELVYRVVSYYYFINRKTGQGLGVAILSNVAASVFWIFISFTVIRLYITNGFWGLLP